jgi:hypothetical protein
VWYPNEPAAEEPAYARSAVGIRSFVAGRAATRAFWRPESWYEDDALGGPYESVAVLCKNVSRTLEAARALAHSRPQ